MTGQPLPVVQALDARLARLTRSEGLLRLRLGQALEAMGNRGGHLALGFSSLSAYAHEACQRSGRWVENARCVARRLQSLPVLRAAVECGAVSFSKAELLARTLSPGNEKEWVERAQRLSVRALREALAGGDEAGGDEAGEPCTLTVTLDREESWLFEATRILVAALDPSTRGVTDAVIRALLAEGESTLCTLVPGIDPYEDPPAAPTPTPTSRPSAPAATSRACTAGASASPARHPSSDGSFAAAG